MYNRYIPGANGDFSCIVVDDPPQPKPPESPPPNAQPQTPLCPPPAAEKAVCPPPKAVPSGCGSRPSLKLPFSLDADDLLILLILALLILDGEDGDTQSLLLAFAAFMLL